MNQLQNAILEKIGNDNGFEHVLSSDPEAVVLASAQHPARTVITITASGYCIELLSASPVLLTELQRSFPQAVFEHNRLFASGEAGLALLLRRAANLSRALPSQAAHEYQQAVSAELAELPPGIVGTEIERIVRQRVGQNKFREAMLDYWGGACAVTGVSVPEVLRASHAKPWAECATDAERLDVFNGFLLSANLDALFDRFLISFDEDGWLFTAPILKEVDLSPLGVLPKMRLRWINSLHLRYLEVHQKRTASQIAKLQKF